MRSGPRRQTAPKLTLTQERSKRAVKLRAQLLTFRELHGLTWEELQALMHSKGSSLTIATLKRFGLGYTSPHVRTNAAVDKFLKTISAAQKVGEDAAPPAT
jgi:hypothetical protein